MGVMEWFTERGLNEDEINFTLTFIPTLSVLIQENAFRGKIIDLLKNRFSLFHADDAMDFGDYQQFDSFLQEIFQGKINIDEFLSFVQENGCCMSWCDRIIASKNHGHFK